jgi:hypothetical protein
MWLRELGAVDVVGRSHDVASLIRHLEDIARLATHLLSPGGDSRPNGSSATPAEAPWSA